MNGHSVATAQARPEHGDQRDRAPAAAHVGVVVIGRNEAPRLGACLDALASFTGPLVYVDSGSHDASPDIAAARGVAVLRLHDGPYTAARGRQSGLEYLQQKHGALQYVQFVDGDCILAADWLTRATRFLDENPQAAVVVGRLRERRAHESLLIRLVDADWDLPTGEIDAIGGISLARIAALQSVGGWRTGLISGEELDLGARLRAAGWKLHRLSADMTLHDIGITSVRELWRRSIRAGFGYAELAQLHGFSRCRRWLRRAVGNVVYGGLLPLLLVAGLLCWWPAAAAVLALYFLLIARIAWRRVRRGDPPGFALLYGLTLLAGKFAGALGTLRYLAVRCSGRRAHLIEYKSQPQSVRS